ncbi:MAG: uroporphyrinogen decarboxylase family protein [Armatimonadota bacterium]
MTLHSTAITPRQRVYAAIEGKALDYYPVTAPYLMLSNADHWCDLTGLPVWQFYAWTLANPEEHAEMYRVFYDALPFETVQPWFGASRAHRANTEVVLKDGVAYYHYKKEDQYAPVPTTIHESGSGGGENETRVVFTEADARERIGIGTAEEIIAGGSLDYLAAALNLYGDTHFVISGGVVNTFYACAYYVGMMNFYTMLIEEPALIHYMSRRLLEQNIAQIRAFAAVGGDAIYIDDATATCDMISPALYEEFSLPYLTEQVREIQRLGKKAILIYFGGIGDRVEQIASTGADVLMMEASMKGFVNDYAAIADRVAGKLCLTGNLNPYDDIERLDNEAFDQRVKQQLRLGHQHGRYITSTGSPLTPGTSVARMQRFIEMAHTPPA